MRTESPTDAEAEMKKRLAAVLLIFVVAVLTPARTVRSQVTSELSGEQADLAQELTNPLDNHTWSFAGDDDHDIKNTSIHPFVTYTWPRTWTVSAQSETTYEWEIDEWSVPVNVSLAKLVTAGRLPVSVQAGVGHWPQSADVGHRVGDPASRRTSSCPSRGEREMIW